MKKVAAWDLPTRLFHWLLVILMACAYLSYEYGDVNMTWHMWNGYALLTLGLYRLMWGLWGSSTARFSQFIKGPGVVFGYVKSQHTNQPQKYLGHNPVGALMVLSLLGLILVQGSMGLFTSDDIMVEGPLAYKASSDWVTFAGSIHRIGFWVITGFVGLHVFAVAFYLLVKKENLIRPMISGKKDIRFVPDGGVLIAAPLSRALLSVFLSCVVLWLVVNAW